MKDQVKSELVMCRICETAKQGEGHFRRNAKSKTGYEYCCNECKAEIKEQRQRDLEAYRVQRRTEAMRVAVKCLLEVSRPIQKQHRAPIQYVYTLVDPRTDTVHYVGITGNPKRRYSRHLHGREGGTNEAKGEWVDELLALGLRPGMNIVEEISESPDTRTRERERRWMFHFLQQGHPLTNIEALTSPHLTAAIQATTVNFLTEPLDSEVWYSLDLEWEKDGEIMRELRCEFDEQWGCLRAKWFARVVAERYKAMNP